MVLKDMEPVGWQEAERGHTGRATVTRSGPHQAGWGREGRGTHMDGQAVGREGFVGVKV